MHGRIRRFSAPLVAVTVTLALTATACGSTADRTFPAPSKSTARVVPVSAQQQQALATADDAFAHSLWSELASRDGNIVVSPASIATALQMAYVGARGDTATEMARALHLGSNATPDDVVRAASRLITQLQAASGKGSLLRVADAVWLQRDFPVQPAFRTAMSDGFASAFHQADFAGHGEDARKAINAAIAAQTRDRIKDLLPPGTDLSDTRLVLTNAVYLKAAWASPFEPSATAPAPFTRGDGQVVRPKTMTATEAFDYAATSGYRAVRLPYAGGRLAMTLLLPAAGRPLAWPATAPVFRPEPVDLAVPKFRFSWNDDLSGLLASLGMRTAFTDAADFGGMSPRQLQIGAVRHKAFIDVSESGTEAAAATSVDIVAGAAPAPVSVQHLHFDRPFLFRIDDTVTGLPLFLGKVADPTLGA
jgi:serpin B